MAKTGITSPPAAASKSWETREKEEQKQQTSSGHRPTSTSMFNHKIGPFSPFSYSRCSFSAYNLSHSLQLVHDVF